MFAINILKKMERCYAFFCFCLHFGNVGCNCISDGSILVLVFAVNAYVGGSRPSWKSNSKVFNDKHEKIIAKGEGQAASEALNAA